MHIQCFIVLHFCKQKFAKSSWACKIYSWSIFWADVFTKSLHKRKWHRCARNLGMLKKLGYANYKHSMSLLRGWCLLIKTRRLVFYVVIIFAQVGSLMENKYIFRIHKIMFSPQYMKRQHEENWFILVRITVIQSFLGIHPEWWDVCPSLGTMPMLMHSFACRAI